MRLFKFVPMALLLVACGGGSTTSNADQNNKFKQLNPTAQLLVDESELNVKYGEYAELSVAFAGANQNQAVNWSVLGTSLPTGFQVYDTRTSNLILYGTPTFTGQWCTVLVAQVQTTDGSQGLQGMREICFVSEENTALQYPRFTTTDRYIDQTNPNVNVQKTIQVQSVNGQQLTGEIIETSLPQTFQLNYGFNSFTLSGQTDQLGSFPFAVKVRDAQGIENSRQFVLLVEDVQTAPPQCPAGYYFDVSLNYCVPSNQQNCPTNTYYNVETNTCVQYPAPPPTITCAPGYFFDPFLNTCTPTMAQRCPLNYQWDTYQGRCVRMPYTCSYGQTYDWLRQECVYVWTNYHSCSIGYHWDSCLNRCVRNYDNCYAGFYFDYRYDRCTPVNYRCSWDETWDPYYGRCVRRHVSGSCPGGTRWDYDLNRCVSVYTPPSRYCPPGTHMDHYLDRCVSNVTPRPIPGPAPRPVPVPVPRPVPGPGPRPVPVPPSNCPPGTHYDTGVGRCVSNATPRPVPGPGPAPRPVPAPVPGPAPRPVPAPVPGPAPRPVPAPVPGPAPRPVPAPAPAPAPRPVPAPAPAPRPVPAPAPAPAPRPAPAPAPAPRPAPAPAPAPRPAPAPAPAPRPPGAPTRPCPPGRVCDQVSSFQAPTIYSSSMVNFT